MVLFNIPGLYSSDTSSFILLILNLYCQPTVTFYKGYKLACEHFEREEQHTLTELYFLCGYFNIYSDGNVILTW